MIIIYDYLPSSCLIFAPVSTLAEYVIDSYSRVISFGWMVAGGKCMEFVPCVHMRSAIMFAVIDVMALSLLSSTVASVYPIIVVWSSWIATHIIMISKSSKRDLKS